MDRLANLLLRVGVVFAFIYPPFDALGNPDSWIGYVPQFVSDTAHSLGVSNIVLLHGFGIIEVVIALWILSGWRIYAPAILAAVILVVIVAFNLSQFEILFRDLSIAAAALALAVDAWHRNDVAPRTSPV